MRSSIPTGIIYEIYKLVDTESQSLLNEVKYSNLPEGKILSQEELESRNPF